MNLTQMDTRASGAGTKVWLAATQDMLFTIWRWYFYEALLGKQDSRASGPLLLP